MTPHPRSSDRARSGDADLTPGSKVLTLAALLKLREGARAEGKAVVQCHGCFDIVHPGHIRHLRQARSEGDILLVSITGDSEMKKGTGRPLIPEELRAENLAALSFVDWVYVEERPTAAELLSEVKPDVYVKGREYELNIDPRFQAERAAVENGGGRVVFSSGDVVFSSTSLIAAMENSVDPYEKRLRQLLAMDELCGEKLTRLVAAFRGKRVVVVGETILDTYFLCDRPDVAGESPIMTLRPIERRGYDGGAAIIARHLAAMGAEPILITGISLDTEGEDLTRRLALEGVEVRSIETGRKLPEKQRYLVGAQKVMKLDLVEPFTLDAATQDQLVGLAMDAASEGGPCDAAIIADFGQGLLSPGMVSRLCRELRPVSRVLSGDVSGKRASLRMMHGMDLLCPSETEARAAFQSHTDGLPSLAWRVVRKTGAKAVVITMGADGLIGFSPSAPSPASSTSDGYASQVTGEHVPALGTHAVDALGCGDALLATATLALCSGASLLAASFLGSIAAAVEAQRLGNIVVNGRDLRHGIARVHASHMTYAEPESHRSSSPSSGASPLRMPVQLELDKLRATRASA
ncbi:MAG: adenylyltransferase/cytidyltransferase family protein [Pyrinomonadaceae bacterium]|nr:adenylyltransferase/cytidyltransferase family protein [Phycisphaerales bacterium]